MNVTLLSRLRRARWVHGLQLLVFTCWVANPFPGAFSYWTDTNGDRVKEEVANPPEGDSWFDQDSDGDSLTNSQEAVFGSDPYQIDADFDGLTDQIERDYADPSAPFDPWNWDSDGDGYSDHDEFYQRLWGWQPQINYVNLTPGGFYSYADADGDGTKNPEDWDFNVDRDNDGTVNWQDGSPSFNGVGGMYMDDANNGVWQDPGVWIGGNWYPSGTVDSDMDGTPDHLDVYPWGSFWYNGTEYGGSWQDSDYDSIPDAADAWPYNSAYYGFGYNGNWYWGSWQDSDSDGIPDAADSWPYDSNNGANYYYNGSTYSGYWSDQDNDGVPDPADSHPWDGSLQTDFDNDGRNVADDSHPGYSWLWSDWNFNWSNNDTDGDEDGTPDIRDSHPRESWRSTDWNNDGSNDDPSSDFDGDGRSLENDSHPANGSLWSDWNFNGTNNDANGDEDAREDGEDSHPRDPTLWSDWNGNGTNNDSDGDEDGTADAEDSHPRFNGLRSDWNGDGDDNDGDWDEDGIANGNDSHPRDGGVSSDGDGDGRNEAEDSHPQNNSLWSDWDGNGINNDADGDEDGWADGSDSHPRQNNLWNDFDGDGVNLDHDSDPQNNSLWSDWNHNGTNNDADWDEDNVPNENDSSPYVALLWSDWDGNGVNNDSDGDEDGAVDALDSHPRNAAFWGDWNYDGSNDTPADNADGDARDNTTDSDPLNAALWSDWNHDGDNNDADADEDGYTNEDDSHPFDPALSTDWNFDGDNNEADMDEDGRMSEHTASDGTFVPNQDSHPRNGGLWSDWDGNGVNNDADGDEDGLLDENDSHPMHAHLWSDWDFNQTNNDSDGDEDGVIDSQDSDPRNNALKSDWNHDGDDNESDWDEDGHDNGSDSHPANAALWADYDGDGHNAEDDSDPADGALWSDWNHDGDNHATDGDEDGFVDLSDSDPRNPALWIDWNRDGYNDGSEPADRDGDGLFDNVDNYPDDPYNNADSDSDGLTDYDEVFTHGTERFDVDSDDDFLTDYEELLIFHTNPLLQKSDPAQLIADGYLYLGQDSDADGLPDLLEDHYGLNKNDAADAAGDLDGDGVSNLQAYQGGWSLTVYLDTFDADGDRITDAVEDRWAAVAAGSLDKNNFDDAVADFDGDGVMNYEEINLGLSVTQAVTTRSDGWSDAQVLAWALMLGDYRREADYVRAAWEQVQLPDHAHRYLLNMDLTTETRISTSNGWQTQNDFNGDGVPDGLAHFAAQFTPPVPQRQHAADADGDGMSDAWEYRHHLNPRSVHDGGQADMLYTPENLPVMQSFEQYTAENSTDPLYANEAYQWYQQSFQREVAAWALIDPDGDTLSNLKEFQLGTNPRIADTDGDGASDLVEMQAGTNPTLAGGGTSTGGSTGGTGGSGTTTGGGTSGGTTTGGTSGGGSSTGNGSGGNTPPDAEAEVVSRGAHAGLGSETRVSVRLVPFDSSSSHRYESEAREMYDQTKENAEEITVDEPPHEVAVRWEFFVETDIGMERREIFGTEAEAQAAKDAQSPEGGSDPTTNDKPWHWRLAGKQQSGDGPAEVRKNYSRKTWDAPPEVFKSADELEEMTADAPAGWAEEILQPPGSPLGPEQWMTRTEKETSAQGRWVTTGEGGEGSGPRFPEGAAVEVRLKRVDVSAEAMQQRVTRTFLRITQTVDDDPETEDDPPVVAEVTLTIEPGQKVSTTGTGPGAANGCVLLVGRPPESKNSVRTDRLVEVDIKSMDRHVMGRIELPFEKWGLEFASGSGAVLARFENIEAALQSSNNDGANYHIYRSAAEMFDDDEIDEVKAGNVNSKHFESKVVLFSEGGALRFSTIFDDLGEITIRLLKGSETVAEIQHTLTGDQGAYAMIVEMARSISQVNHLPSKIDAVPMDQPYAEYGDDEDIDAADLPVLAVNLVDGSGSSTSKTYFSNVGGEAMALVVPQVNTITTSNLGHTALVTLARPVGAWTAGSVMRLVVDNPAAIHVLTADGSREIQDYSVSLDAPSGDLALAATEAGAQVRVQGLQTGQIATLTWQLVGTSETVQSGISMPVQIGNAAPAAEGGLVAFTPLFLPQAAASAAAPPPPLPTKPFSEIPSNLAARARNIVSKLLVPVRQIVTNHNSRMEQLKQWAHLQTFLVKGFCRGYSFAVEGEVEGLVQMAEMAAEGALLKYNPQAQIHRAKQVFDALNTLGNDIATAGGITNYVTGMINAIKNDVEDTFDWLNHGYVSDENDAYIVGCMAGYGTEVITFWAIVRGFATRGLGVASKAVQLIKQGKQAIDALSTIGKFKIKMLMWSLNRERFLQIMLNASREHMLIQESVDEVARMLIKLSKAPSVYGTSGGAMQVLAERAAKIRRVDRMAKWIAETNRKATGFGDWVKSEHVLRELAAMDECIGVSSGTLSDAALKGYLRYGHSVCVITAEAGSEMAHTMGIKSVRNYLAGEADLSKLPGKGTLPQAEAEAFFRLFDEGSDMVLQADGTTWVYKGVGRFTQIRINGQLSKEQHRIAHVLHHKIPDPARDVHGYYTGTITEMFEIIHETLTRGDLVLGGSPNNPNRILELHPKVIGRTNLGTSGSYIYRDASKARVGCEADGVTIKTSFPE